MSYTNNSSITETKLLYRMDLKNKVSLFNYIDGKYNLFFVIKLANNMTLGGFSIYPRVRPGE